MTVSPRENSPYDSGVIPVVPTGKMPGLGEFLSLGVAASSNLDSKKRQPWETLRLPLWQFFFLIFVWNAASAREWV